MLAENAVPDRAQDALVAVELPALPTTRANAMALLLRQDVALAELAIVIESDPALTVAVMRAAHSAYSAPAKPVQTAADSIVRLGLTGIRRIVVGMMLQHSFDESDHGRQAQRALRRR